MKQNSKTSVASIARVVLPHLRHPTKLRLVLCTTILGGWYALFFAPLSEQMTETKTLVEKERKRVTLAREITQLKAKLVPYEKRIPVGADVNELRRHVTDHIRVTPLRLIDVKPARSKAVGPFDAHAVILNVEGKYKEIDKLLAWIETDQQLLRVDTIKLAPVPQDPSHLVASLTVLGLTDKPVVETPQAGAGSPAESKPGGSKASPSADGLKPGNAHPSAETDTGSRAKGVRKKVGEIRQKIGDFRGNAGGVGGSPAAKSKASAAPKTSE